MIQSQHISDANDRLATAMADAISKWQEWCHRRVDSYVSLGGDRGRVHHSMDCTPPPDPAFSLDANQRSRSINEVFGQAIIPIAIVKKDALHEFDSRLPNGESMPILGKSENIRIAFGILRFLYQQALELDELPDALSLALERIVGSSADSKSIADELVDHGVIEGSKVIDAELLKQKPYIVELTKDLSTGFILCGVIPVDLLGERIVLKISYLWKFDSLHRFKTNTKVAITGRRSLRLPMTGCNHTKSYHLEFRVPDGARCIGMKLPASDGVESTDGTADPDHSKFKVGGPTIHLISSYEKPPEFQEAWAELAIASDASYWTAVISTTMTSILLGILYRAGDIASIQSALNVQLLLAIPAVLIGLMSAKDNHSLSSGITIPHQIALVASATILIFVALVWGLSTTVDDRKLVAGVGAILALCLGCLVLLRRYFGPLRRVAKVLYYGANRPPLSVELKWREEL